MQAALRFSAVWAIAALGFLCLMGWLHANGFLSEAVIRLWSKAILVADGPPGYRSSDTLYPPLPFVVTLLLHHVIGALTLPPPVLIAVGSAGLMVALWWSHLTARGGYGAGTALLIVFLLGTNPVLLVAVSEGPEMALTCLGVWTFARGMVHLRTAGNAPDMMMVAAGLMLIAMSSGFGLLIAFGALPFLALAARPQNLLVSPIGYTLAMCFPVMCAAGSLAFVAAIFDAPLIRQANQIAAKTGPASSSVIIVALSLPAIAAIVRLRRQRDQAIPLICAILSIGGAMALDRIFRLLDDQILASAPLIAVSAAALRFWPPGPTRDPAVAAMLTMTWLSALILVAGNGTPDMRRWLDALRAQPPVTETSVELADILRGRESVLIDAERNPDLVVALGSLDGLVLAGTASYELTLLGSIPRQDLIVLRASPGVGELPDRVARRFPQAGDRPPAGYRLLFSKGEWTVLQRDPSG